MKLEPLDLSSAKPTPQEAWGRPARKSAAEGPPRPRSSNLRMQAQISAGGTQAFTGAQLFSAASVGDMVADWPVLNSSATSELRSAGWRIRQRARELLRNNPYIEKFACEVEKNVVGDAGVLIEPKVKKLRGTGLRDSINGDLKDAFKRWARPWNASTDRRSSFRDIQLQVARQLAVESEFLILIDRTDDNPFHFSLQVVDSDRLDWNFQYAVLKNGNRVDFGVEYTPQGRIVAYHIFDRHPADYSSGPRQRIRYDARDVIYDFLSTRPGQLRAIPRMASAMYRLNMLRGYDEAELAAARKGALQTMAIKSDLPSDQQYEGETGGDGGGPEVIDLDPSITALHLRPGDEVQQFLPTHPTAAYPAFTKTALHSIAAGLDLAYMTLTGDIADANFSSARVGLLNERETWYSLQQWLIEHLLVTVWRAWLENANLYGEIQIPGVDVEGVIEQTDFRPRGFDWVDPEKDMQASIKGIDNGLETWSWVLARRGYDIDDYIETYKSDLKKFADAGISLPLGLNSTGKPAAGETTATETDDAPGKKVAPPLDQTPEKQMPPPPGKKQKPNGHAPGLTDFTGVPQ